MSSISFTKGLIAALIRGWGAHLSDESGAPGVRFTVWAPGVRSVSVAGDFNGWDGAVHPMASAADGSLWTVFVPGVQAGALYKYRIEAADGRTFLKADPYAFAAELRPETASRVSDLDRHTWRDEAWMRARKETFRFDHPMNIYEAHLGSWRQRGEKTVVPG